MIVLLFIVIVMPLSAIGVAASAQESNEVVLDATYLGAPTDWCPADAGVPLVIKMDGPDIVKTPQDWPVTVRERRRGQSSSIVFSELNTSSLQRPRGDIDSEVIGRFSAEFQVCQDPWNTPRATGRWRLTADDGSQLDGGSFEENRRAFSSPPFFSRVSQGSDSLFTQFDERWLFTADRPKVTISQTFAAEPDKE